MKNIIIILLMLAAPAYALCPIDAGETVCTLPEFREHISPSYQIDSSIGGVGQPNIELQPLKRKDPMDQMRSPNNKLNYNSGCQFGVCVQDPVKRSEMLNQ